MMGRMKWFVLACVVVVLAAWCARWDVVPMGGAMTENGSVRAGAVRLDRWTGHTVPVSDYVGFLGGSNSRVSPEFVEMMRRMKPMQEAWAE
jgi:hypothetical protein